PPVAAANVDLDAPEAKPANENVTLSVRSTPPSNVVVDGRPLGSTPREIAVSPGEHSIVFVHPSKGRKSVRVRATPGKAAVASVEF
ncbi:MAG TPA: PEGA domain-containing protein, partial [Polyangiaceae bacterium]